MTSRRRQSELRPYQRRMARLIIRWKCVLLAAEMGLGKSIATLTAIRALLLVGDVRRVLIVAPLLVATDTWPQEIEGWEHTRGLDYAVAVGTDAERRAALARRADITIINRENFVWLFKVLEGWPWPFDMVVWDESSTLGNWAKRTTGTKKNPKKRNLTRFGALAQIQKHVEYMVLLSGTPCPRGLMDLGGQCYILDGGERLGETKTAFVKRWFDSDYMGWEQKPKWWAEEDIMDRMGDIMVFLKSTDYLDLPEKIWNDRWITLPPKVLQEYRKFARHLVSEAYDVEAVSSGVLAGKLLQFANGSMYQDRDPVTKIRPVVYIHDLKLQELESVVHECAGQPLLVAYNFTFDKDSILKKFGKRVRLIAKEKNGIRDWNRGDVEIGLVHPAEIGHGTNIQTGGHILCWFGPTWNKELYDQLNARLWRSGQRSDFVTFHRILARDTIDERVIDKLERAGNTQIDITDCVRQYMWDVEDDLAW